MSGTAASISSGDIHWQIHRQVLSAFEGLDDPVSATNSGLPIRDFERIDVNPVTLVRAGSTSEFTFAGVRGEPLGVSGAGQS